MRNEMFAKSFGKQLTAVFGYSEDAAKETVKKQSRNTKR